MNNSPKATKTFLQSYQEKNTMALLKKTVEKIINDWLISDDEDHRKLKHLQQFSKKDSGTDTLSVEDNSLPDFVTRLWLKPHQALDTLDPNIPIAKIRNLIIETAKETAEERMTLLNNQEKVPQYP